MEAEAATDSNSIASDEETDRRPSLNTLALMRKATTPANISSIAIKDWRSVIYKGVLWKNNTQFWVDEKLHKNCFLVLPKACDIDRSKKGSCLIIKLKKLSWLLIEGRFKTRTLSPYTTYEVAFVVKLIGTDYEWQYPVELELCQPNGTKQIRTEYLKPKPEEEWINLRAGEFMMAPWTAGTIYFALHETFDPRKSGLIFRGVLIHPKKD
ncbi:hypothetical protein ACJRO7_005561 [Eucalyptus globulus]|uniref:Uncharacterized protein n=1 Tax=Eucalyptus globulus TaxID=34317 RepID=A0ABD3J3U3_EUCGL